MVEETANGEEDDKEGDDEGPGVGDSRGGGDDIVVGNETLGGELIVNHMALGSTYATIEYSAWHHEVVMVCHHRGQEFVPAILLVHHPYQFFIVVKE